MDKTSERLAHLLQKAQSEYSETHFVVRVPEFLSKKFIGYCSMKEDLELALEYIKILSQHPDKIIKSALTISLISLYAKCFADASKNNYPKLEHEKIFKDYADHYKIHGYLVDLRHQLIAHRGKSENEVGIAYMSIPKDEKEQSQIRFSQLKQTSFSSGDLSKMEVLFEFLIPFIENKIQINGQKIYEAMLDSFSAKQLSQMGINNIK